MHDGREAHRGPLDSYRGTARKTSQGGLRPGEGCGWPSLKVGRYLGAPVYRCGATTAAPGTLPIAGAAAAAGARERDTVLSLAHTC